MPSTNITIDTLKDIPSVIKAYAEIKKLPVEKIAAEAKQKYNNIVNSTRKATAQKIAAVKITSVIDGIDETWYKSHDVKRWENMTVMYITSRFQKPDSAVKNPVLIYRTVYDTDECRLSAIVVPVGTDGSVRYADFINTRYSASKFANEYVNLCNTVFKVNRNDETDGASASANGSAYNGKKDGIIHSNSDVSNKQNTTEAKPDSDKKLKEGLHPAKKNDSMTKMEPKEEVSSDNNSNNSNRKEQRLKGNRNIKNGKNNKAADNRMKRDQAQSLGHAREAETDSIHEDMQNDAHAEGTNIMQPSQTCTEQQCVNSNEPQNGNNANVNVDTRVSTYDIQNAEQSATNMQTSKEQAYKTEDAPIPENTHEDLKNKDMSEESKTSPEEKPDPEYHDTVETDYQSDGNQNDILERMMESANFSNDENSESITQDSSDTKPVTNSDIGQKAPEDNKNNQNRTENGSLQPATQPDSVVPNSDFQFTEQNNTEIAQMRQDLEEAKTTIVMLKEELEKQKNSQNALSHMLSMAEMLSESEKYKAVLFNAALRYFQDTKDTEHLRNALELMNIGLLYLQDQKKANK